MVTNVRVDDWQRLHQQLRGIAARRAALDAEEARYLRMADRIQIWKQLGYVHMNEYLERELGYTPTQGTERLRIARELADLPRIEAALGEGALSYSAVRELTRIATRDTEGTWLAEVYGKNLRQIEALVSGRKRGDRPTDPTNPDLIKRVVRFELSPAAFAALRQTQSVLADEQGSRLDDSAFIEALCRRALAGDGSSDHPLHQISLTVCQSCQRGWQNGAGREIEVGPEVIAEARCDAEHIGSLSDAQPARVTTTVTPRVRRQVLARDHHACTVPGCRSARNLSVHHIEFRSDGGGNELWNMTTLCTAHHARLHEGLLTIRGKAPDALEVEWRHPPGRQRERGGNGERPIDGVIPGTSDTDTPESVGHADPTTLSDVACDSSSTGDNARVSLEESEGARIHGSQGPSNNEVTSNAAPEMYLDVGTTDVRTNDQRRSDLGTGDPDMCEGDSAARSGIRHPSEALTGGPSPAPGVGAAVLPHVGAGVAVDDGCVEGMGDRGIGDQGSQAMGSPGTSDRGLGGPGLVEYDNVTRSRIRHITSSDALVGGPTWRRPEVGAAGRDVGTGVAVDDDDFVDEGMGDEGGADECGPRRGDQDTRERNTNGIAGSSRHSATATIHALVSGPTWRQAGVGAAAATVFPHVGTGVAVDDDELVNRRRDDQGTQGRYGAGTGDRNTGIAGTAHSCSRHNVTARIHAFVGGPTRRQAGVGAAAATVFPHVGAGVAADDDDFVNRRRDDEGRGTQRRGTQGRYGQGTGDRNTGIVGTAHSCSRHSATARIHALVSGPTWRQAGAGAAVFPHVGDGVAIDDDDFVDQSRDDQGTQGRYGQGTGDSDTKRSGTAHSRSRHNATTRIHALVSGPTWRQAGAGAAAATVFPHVGAGVAVDDESVLNSGSAPASRRSREGAAHVESQLSADWGAIDYDAAECCAIDNAVKSALVTSGYRAREARAAVEQARAGVGSQVTLEQLLREALRSCGKAVAQTYEPAPRHEYTDYTESAGEGRR